MKKTEALGNSSSTTFQSDFEKLKNELIEIQKQSRLESLRLEKKADKRFAELQTLFTSQWGKLIESLVEGDLVKILNQKGIKINYTSTNISGKEFEFDIIAHNGEEIVIVEVKTTLRKNDVEEFIDKLKMAKTWMPSYKNNTIYGAVAYLKENESSARYAEKNGLFVIRATGNSATITNNENFKAIGF